MADINFKEALKSFRSDLSEEIPGIIENCLWVSNEVWEEHYQLIICALIKKHFLIMSDLVNLFDWMNMDKTFFNRECFKKIASFDTMWKLFRDNNGGKRILDHITKELRDIDLVAANTPPTTKKTTVIVLDN